MHKNTHSHDEGQHTLVMTAQQAAADCKQWCGVLTAPAELLLHMCLSSPSAHLACCEDPALSAGAPPLVCPLPPLKRSRRNRQSRSPTAAASARKPATASAAGAASQQQPAPSTELTHRLSPHSARQWRPLPAHTPSPASKRRACCACPSPPDTHAHTPPTTSPAIACRVQTWPCDGGAASCASSTAVHVSSPLACMHSSDT